MVIFDFDGVIADSEPVHFEAFLSVFKPRGVTFDFPQYTRELIGFDDRDGVHHLLAAHEGRTPGPELDALVSELCRQKQEAFNAIVQTQGMPTIAGAVALIDHLVEHDVPIALATGATHEDLKQAFGPADRLRCFDAIVTADDVERSKPDPQTYLQAFEQACRARGASGWQPAQAMAIEDTPTGLTSALRAGLRTLGLSTTHDKAELQAAERVVPDLTGIDWPTLQQWYND